MSEFGLITSPFASRFINDATAAVAIRIQTVILRLLLIR
jgi:hypothetical protein